MREKAREARFDFLARARPDFSEQEKNVRLVAGIAMATDECTGARQHSGHHLLGLVFDGLQAGCT